MQSLAPHPTREGPMNTHRALLRTYVLPQSSRVAGLAALLLLNLLAQFALPWLVKQFIDAALAKAALQTLLITGGVHLLLATLANVTHIGWTYVAQNIGLVATNRIRADLTLHCLKLDMGFHNSHTPGELIERIDGDVGQMSTFLSSFLVQVALNGILLLGVIAVVMTIDVRIALAVACGIAIAILSVHLFSPYRVRISTAERQASAELMGFVEERLSGTEDIRANGATGYVMRRHAELSRILFRVALKTALVGTFSWRAMVSAINFGAIAGVIMGAFGYLGGAWSLGTVYAIFAYCSMTQIPAERLSRQLGDFQTALASIGRVRALFNTQPMFIPTPVESAIALPSGPLSVALDAITFAYPGDDTVLHDITLRLESGETLGIRGRTGSGKTTLSRLLLRLYDPTRGSVLVGGVDLRSVAAPDLAARVAVVTQDVQLFSASVRDNLTLFDSTINPERILAALETVGMREAVLALPNGLDTLLAPGSSGFSAGEAQLLAFARTFLRNPGLVILDEASSRLDPMTECKLNDAVNLLFRGRSGIVIAHRLTTLDRVDKILILEAGEVREFGTRSALVRDPDSRFSQLLNSGMEAALV